ncbi:MAG: winged helix-turn-helix domain-containing protein [Myxococcota bacterium]
MLAKPHLDGLEPRPETARVPRGFRILPTASPCVGNGTVWVLRDGRPAAASPEELAVPDDACGRGSFELPWLHGAVNGWPVDPVPSCMRIAYAAFDTGAAETAAHAMAPSHARSLPAPFATAASAVVSALLIRHGRAPDLLDRVLTELIANAVGHRSYAPAYVERALVVEDFTDLVRVRRPGAPPRPVVQPDGSLRGRWSRNPRLMARIGEAGLVHQQGRGLAIAPRLARDAGYDMCVRVGADEVIAELVPVPSRWELAPDRLRQRQPEAVRADRIVDHLWSSMEASVADIATSLGMPSSTVRASIRRLVAAGRVEPTCEASRSPLQRYRLTPAEAARRP